jgi:hypothetical protein
VKGTREVENTAWKFVENLKVTRQGPSVLVIGKLVRIKTFGKRIS